MSSSECSDSDADMEYDAFECDNESEDIAEGSSRLSRFKRPKISDRKYRSNKQSKKNKGKGKGKGRHFGKLAHLKNMTLDIFFEITSHLQPMDILQLSRVSKQFRSMFASKNSRHIWVAAKRNLAAPMPECPADLSEPQYISLMFEHHCQACGKNRAQKTDFALRVRFCGHCFNENVVKGTQILRAHPLKLPETIFNLVPRSLLKASGVYRSGRGIDTDRQFDSVDNGRSNAYYFPEIDSVIGRYKKLQSDYTALEAYQTQQKAIASQMMKDAITLTDWVAANKSHKYDEDKEHTENRRASIETKLVELGWDRKYFPNRYHTEWYKLLNQPRELSPRIWKAIYPKLVAVLEEQKAKEVREQIRARCDERKREFKPFWEAYTKGLQDSRPEEPMILPDHSDVSEFPPVKKVLFENEGHIPVTRARWESVIHYIPEYLDLFQKKVKHTLVQNLEVFTSLYYVYQNPPAWDVLPDSEEVLDLSPLEHASALFRFDRYNPKGLVAGVPGILENQQLENMPWALKCGRLYGDVKVKPTVEMILRVLGLPEDTSLATMRALDGRFLCLCGHPEHREPMSFTSLVAIIIEENTTYEQAQQSKVYNGLSINLKDIDVYNDHSLTSEEPFVALLSPGGEAIPLIVEPEGGDDSDDDISASAAAAYSDRKYCKYCFVLTSHRFEFKSKGEINYHMKAKHHRETVEDDDVLKPFDLTTWRNTLRN